VLSSLNVVKVDDEVVDVSGRETLVDVVELVTLVVTSKDTEVLLLRLESVLVRDVLSINFSIFRFPFCARETYDDAVLEAELADEFDTIVCYL